MELYGKLCYVPDHFNAMFHVYSHPFFKNKVFTCILGSSPLSPHLEAFIGHGSSVEGLLIGRFQFQCSVTVLLGLCESFQLQVAQGSANTNKTCDGLFVSPGANCRS